MENISQMSLLEVATNLMEQKRSVQNIYKLIREVLEIKGIDPTDKASAAQLYIDITTSSKFVYMGDDEWDLKARQSLDEFDKDGSAFNTAEAYEEDEIDSLDLDEDDDFDYDDDYEDDEDEEDDNREDNLYDDEEEDDFDDEDDSDSYDDEDDLDDGEDLERYTEEGFNEDKYNDYMDDYEDMYE